MTSQETQQAVLEAARLLAITLPDKGLIERQVVALGQLRSLLLCPTCCGHSGQSHNDFEKCDKLSYPTTVCGGNEVHGEDWTLS